MKNKPFSHVLQKTGILKNFTVAKIVRKQDIDELKMLIKSVTTTDAEYKEMLAEEMKKLSDMHDGANPIPGIIYPKSENELKELVTIISKRFCDGVRKQGLNVREMSFLITSIIKDLGLTQADFIKLKDELEDNIEYGLDDDDDENEEYEDDGGPQETY